MKPRWDRIRKEGILGVFQLLLREVWVESWWLPSFLLGQTSTQGARTLITDMYTKHARKKRRKTDKSTANCTAARKHNKRANDQTAEFKIICWSHFSTIQFSTTEIWWNWPNWIICVSVTWVHNFSVGAVCLSGSPGSSNGKLIHSRILLLLFSTGSCFSSNHQCPVGRLNHYDWSSGQCQQNVCCCWN